MGSVMSGSMDIWLAKRMLWRGRHLVMNILLAHGMKAGTGTPIRESLDTVTIAAIVWG